MGFDRQTLGPTYRIFMGVPGASHALEIARRSGLPEGILANASSYLEDERTDVSRLVTNLAERQHKLVKAEEEHQALSHDLREKWRTTDLKELSLRQKELELRKHGLKELRDFLGEARREWDALRERGSIPGGADFGRFAAGIQERIAREESRIEQEAEALAPVGSFEPREGLEVIIARTGRRGRLVRKDKGRRWIVETETLRLSLLPGELRPASDAPLVSPLVSVSYAPASPIDPPVLELHIRGMRLDEAMRLVEKQIDAALIHGLREFSIVHGKGEGILRTAVHEYLRGLNAVADFRFSGPEEGGFGKTNVTLK
jgi:DNA mismatch repair protein MutS2